MTAEKAYKLRDLIRKSSVSLSDEDALEGIELFAPWEADHDYAEGVRFQYAGRLYRTRQAHRSQAQYTPDIVPALYEEVALPGDGTRERPIAYNNNMELEEGKYYSQAGVVYYCFRGTGTAVYNDLADLVNLYVQVAE